jgi:mannose-6-phosphate isomerase-like protein (cupin superfamily)
VSEELFKEPLDGSFAGTMRVDRQPTPYQRYMADEGIPIFVGPGVHNVRELELKPWSRMGVNATFIDLDNTTDLMGMQVIEIPPGGSTEPMRHCYEEKYWVAEGEGTTELSLPDGSGRQRFEWHQNSLFAIPMNAQFQLVNARSTPALLLVGNTAPTVMNTFDNLDFVFHNDFRFIERYDGSADYYKPNTETLATPELGRAMWKTNIIPDIVDTEFPLDNQRSPGYRRIEPNMAGGYFRCFIGEHVPGRYSKAHHHKSGAVLICVKGSGYTYNWPNGIGTRPWASGQADLVERVDYVQGGMVAAAPGGGSWFHQHFSSSPGPLRLLVFSGGVPGTWSQEYGRTNKTKVWTNANIEDGGNSISYRNEDPHIREEFERNLAGNGGTSIMSDDLYA